MEVSLNQEVYYSNKGPVPIATVVESLLALESIIKQTPDVLEAFFPGTKIQNVEVFINEIKTGSLYDDLIVKFIFGSQENFDNALSGIRKATGMEYVMDKHPKLLGVIVSAMLLVAIGHYMGSQSAEDEKKITTIEANTTTIINIGAEIMDMQPEDFKNIIESTLPKKRNEFVKEAIRAVSPARLDPEASIQFSGAEDLVIQSSTVQAFPPKWQLELEEEEEPIDDFENIDLELRAYDLDSSKTGWAVVVPMFNEKKRVRLQLDPNIRPEDLLNKRSIKGDVTIIFKTNGRGDKTPKLVFLREIRSEEPLVKVANN